MGDTPQVNDTSRSCLSSGRCRSSSNTSLWRCCRDSGVIESDIKLDLVDASHYTSIVTGLECVGAVVHDSEFPAVEWIPATTVESGLPAPPFDIAASPFEGPSPDAHGKDAHATLTLPTAPGDDHAPIIAPTVPGADHAAITPPPAPVDDRAAVTPATAPKLLDATPVRRVTLHVDMTQIPSDDMDMIEVPRRRITINSFASRKSGRNSDILSQENVPRPRTAFHKHDIARKAVSRYPAPRRNLYVSRFAAANAAREVAGDSEELLGAGGEKEEKVPVKQNALWSDGVEPDVEEDGLTDYGKSLGHIACNLAHRGKDGFFIFCFKYGKWAWEISRTISELVYLAHTLRLKMYVANIVQGNKDRKATIAQLCTEVDAFQLRTTGPDAYASPDYERNFVGSVRDLLSLLLKDRKVSRSSAMMEFMEVSWLSFDSNRSQKYREGFILKTRGGHKYRQNAVTDMLKCRCVSDTTTSRFSSIPKCFLQKRWLIILNDALCYADKNDPGMKFRSVLWFDTSTSVMAGIRDTGSPGGLVVKNQYRTLKMETTSEHNALKWKKAIQEAANCSAARRRYRFNSFAEVHDNAQVKLLVDGQMYYDALYDVLESATSTIFLSDWWMTPTILLRRCGSSEDSLVSILKRKAEQGVLVRITLYKELESVLYNSSKHAARVLSSAHKNIQVQRHPDHGLVSLGGQRGVLYWSHHEKVVVVDMETSFIGGLDLCLGRYDNATHTLIDCDQEHQVFPGKDYSNPVIKDFYKVTKPDIDMLNRNTEPRMPWHDVHCMIKSKAFSHDLAKHFMQLWNHILTDKNKAKHPHLGYLTLPARIPGHRTTKTDGLMEHMTRRLLQRRSTITDMDSLRSLKENDNSNFPRRFSDPGSYTSQSDSSVLKSNPVPRHTVQRMQTFQKHTTKKIRSRERFKIQDIAKNKRITGFTNMARQFGFLLDEDEEDCDFKIDRREVVAAEETTPTFSNCFVQFVRSSSLWSNGLQTDSSIHSAYITLIQNAKRFIYIENQFFVTSTHRGDNTMRIKNRIGEALVAKIEEKHANNLPFKLYVVMPVMPAFEADAFASEIAWQCRLTMHAQFQSIIDTSDSVIGALQDSLPNIDDWEDYVIFCSLRQVERTPDGVVHATQIYIHSKCAIFDDEHVIIGSANINDRSMLGTRDSETAVVISNKEFARSTRMRLWTEHFNVLKESARDSGVVSRELIMQMLSDPLNPACWNWWIESASRMEKVLYERLHVWPSSTMQVWDDYTACVTKRKNMVATMSRRDWNDLLVEIMTETYGSHVVLFPLYFFLKEDIRFPRPAIARVVESKVFA
eukprot:GEMP01002224.1.p1 GENE.GEMP01002224.1~~GEMP01002224.1.p1  ORF type:complete len:1312 (+),score=226.14 GEMP01002224.1:262-4197(+)